jgi:predicted SprT family Zn-dependent metalloprotease
MRNKIRQLLFESVNKQKIEELFNECIEKYFPELRDTPKPKFSIMSNPKKSGNYKTKYSFVRTPTGHGGYINRPYVSEETIEINRDLFVSPEKLKSVVWHEAIHYAEEHMGESRKTNKLPKWIKQEVDHSGFFKQHMERINQQEGYKMISVTDEYIQGQESASEYFVHIFKCTNINPFCFFGLQRMMIRSKDLWKEFQNRQE